MCVCVYIYICVCVCICIYIYIAFLFKFVSITKEIEYISIQFSSVTQSCPILWPHGLQHARLPSPSLSHEICSNSCALDRWCHPTISSSVAPFPSALSHSQHQGLFQCVSSSYQVAKILEHIVCAWLCLVTQSWLTLCDPMECSPPGSSVHEILQAGILEWVPMSSLRGSS